MYIKYVFKVHISRARKMAQLLKHAPVQECTSPETDKMPVRRGGLPVILAWEEKIVGSSEQAA